MAERQRGRLGGALGGALLDQLVVKIDVDLSGFRRGMAEVIAQIHTLRGAITGQGVAGGAQGSLSTAMTAALVAPVALAATRIGQMRNELRLLTNEMRTFAALGPPGAGGALVPFAAGAGAGAVIDATRNPALARAGNGRWARSYSVEGDDLMGAAGMGRAGAAGAGAARGGLGGWFARMFSPGRTSDAFNAGRSAFPGFDEAVGNLGGAAHSVGSAGRRVAGSRIAQALGLVGLGALFGDLLKLAASLAAVIGGTLTGAFAALATPLGAVVAAVTALVALFVAANWDRFREFGEWFGSRADQLLSGPARDLAAAWGELGDAVGELWRTILEAFQMDENSVVNVFGVVAEVVLRVVASVIEALTGLTRFFAETVRAVTALIRGDWSQAWESLGDAVTAAVDGVLSALDALLPGIRSRLERMGAELTAFFNSPQGHLVGLLMFGPAFAVNQGAGDVANAAKNVPRGRSLRGGGGKGMFGGAGLGGISGLVANPESVGSGPIGAQAEQLERLTYLADSFGQRIGYAFDQAVLGGAKFNDVLKSLLRDLIAMTIRMAVIEPLAQSWAGAIRGAMTGNGNGKGSGNNLLGSIVGSLFGGFFAEGGYLGPGQWGIVGEKGLEVVRAGRHGATIAPVNDNLRIDARSFIDARGADPAAIERLQIALARRDAELPMQIRSVVGDMGQRGRLRFA